MLPESRWRRARTAVVMGIVFVIGTGTGVLGTNLWHSIGAAEYLSRQSDLAQIAERLRRRAEAGCRYPSNLGQVIASVGLEGSVDASELSYPVAGDPYDNTAYDKLMLYERSPRQYGFISGFFEFRQGDGYFRLLSVPEPTTR